MIEVKGKAGPIAVDDGGTGEPACLLVHSRGGRLAFWQSTLTDLRNNHRAVALDLRGHGASAPASFAESGLESIDGASHWLMLDRPEQFALALKEFVDAQSVPQ